MPAQWSIVDHLHASRQLIQEILGSATDWKSAPAFFASTEIAHKMRNKMDHLRANLKNLSRKTAPQMPICGTVLYAVQENGEYVSVSLSTGALLDNNIIPQIQIVDLGGVFKFTPPIDLFQLSAFGLDYPFAKPIDNLRSILRDLEDNTLRLIDEFVEKCDSEGSPVHEFDLKPMYRGMMTRMTGSAAFPSFGGGT